MENKHLSLILALAAGCIVGILLTFLLFQPNGTSHSASEEESAPLYWVAPMDANYRRDKPGKSPMGMDLVPVYASDSNSSQDNPGAVSISSNVVNSLGVRTEEAALKKMSSTIVTVGHVQFDETKLVHIHPRVSGWVERLNVKSDGDRVEKGAPLYALYSPELVNAQEEFLLVKQRGNASLVRAAKDRLRAFQISDAFIEKLNRTQKVSRTVNFYAPQTGVVANLNIREGFYVKPDTTLLSIAQLDTIWVEAEVFQNQASQISVNNAVTITADAQPGKKWDGVIQYIYPTLDKKTRTLRLRIEIENPGQQLKPRMLTQVSIDTGDQSPRLVVPKESLIRTGEQDRVVLALDDGRFKSVEVIVGQLGDNDAEIIQGIEEGDRVVTSAQFLIDSESSKTSDFKRYEEKDEMTKTAWVAATIDEQFIEDREVLVSHEAIEAWNMVGMTMMFEVAAGVDIEALTPSTELHMQIQKADSGMYEIIGTHIMTQGNSSAPAHSAHASDDDMPAPKMDSTSKRETPDHNMHMHQE